MVAQPDDEFLEPSLFLNILEMPFGQEPIDSLQTLFDAWAITSNQNIIQKNKISIFPNPTNGKINIQTLGQKTFNTIEVYNSYGQRLSITNFENTEEINSFQLSNNPTGIYLLKFKYKSELIGLQKVIKL